MAEMTVGLADAFMSHKSYLPNWVMWRDSLREELMTRWPDTKCGVLNDKIHAYMVDYITYANLLHGYR